MGLQKVCIGLLLGMIVLTGCGQEDTKQCGDAEFDYEQKENIVSQNGTDEKNEIDEPDETDRQDEDDDVYYCDIVNASVSKYPELNTTDIAIDEHGWGPMIVSPYASDDVVRAVTYVICETDIATYCYGNYLYDKYCDDFTGYDFEEVYEIIQSRVDESRRQADTFNQQLTTSLENDPEIEISASGEYYYIFDMANFDESAAAIEESVDRQLEIFSSDMRTYSEYYFLHEGRNFTGGYRGPSYAIYLDTYSPDNKIFEYYYWEAKNEWVDIYNDLYVSLIYDYTEINEKLSEQTDNRVRLNCSYGIVYQNTGTELNCIRFEYRMWTEEFKPEEAIELAYEVYTNVRNANEEYNTDRIDGLYIEIDNFTVYEKEYNIVGVYMPFDEGYSLEEFKKIVMDNVVTACDSEPE